MDFAQKRRTEGRKASAAVEDIIALLKPIAAQAGVDLQGRLEEAAAQKEVERRQLAERLQRAVMPLFKYHRGYPGTLGSCVLVRLDSTRNATKSAARQFCLPLWAEDRLTQRKCRGGGEAWVPARSMAMHRSAIWPRSPKARMSAGIPPCAAMTSSMARKVGAAPRGCSLNRRDPGCLLDS